MHASVIAKCNVPHVGRSSNQPGPLPVRGCLGLHSKHSIRRRALETVCSAGTAFPDLREDTSAAFREGDVGSIELPKAQRSSSVPENEEAPGPGEETFNWRAHWYPLGILQGFREDVPNPARLLGEDIVVWKDGEGQWCAAKDECPHRLARLSDGRIDDGKLECRYHGWAFDAEGKCVRNPQADGPAAEATAMASRRSCLKRYPTMVQEGLLWVWPVPGAWLESLGEQPFQLQDEPAWFGMPGYSFTVNPVTFAAMVENALDPDHAPFLHEGVLGRNTKQEAAPIHMRLAGEISTHKGFTVEHDGYTKKQKEKGMTATRAFVPPGTVWTDYTFEDGSGNRAVIHFVPQDPDRTRVYGKFLFKGPEKKGPGGGSPQRPGSRGIPNVLQKLISWIAGTGVAHLMGHPLMDQDNLMLSNAGHNMVKAKRGWRDFYLATSADVGVTAFHRWLSERAGGHPDFAGGFPRELPPVTREEAWDRYDRHTRHCSTCMESVRAIDRWSTGLAAASIGLGATAVLLSPSQHVAVRGLPVLAALCCVALREVLQRVRKQFFSTDRLAGEKPLGL